MAEKPQEITDEEKTFQKEEKRGTFMDKPKFAQLMFDFFAAPVN